MDNKTNGGKPLSDRDDDPLSGGVGERARGQIERFRAARNKQMLTILFSDIVGSTRQQDQLGDECAAELIQCYRTIFRSILAKFDGLEVETAGDSFLAVFVDPADGVSFALNLQARMRAERSRTRDFPQCRVGLHHGQVLMELHDSGTKPVDIYGIQVSTASGIMSLGRGGQILCSRPVFDNAKAYLRNPKEEGFGQLEWCLYGSYKLKPKTLPVEIAEVGEKRCAPFVRPTKHARWRIPLVLGLGGLLLAAVAFTVAAWPGLAHVSNEARSRSKVVADGTEAGVRDGTKGWNPVPTAQQTTGREEGSAEKSVEATKVVTSKPEDKMQSTASLKTALEGTGFPGCMLVARFAADEPNVLKQDDKFVTLEWPLEITVDEDIYFNKVLPKLKETLGAVAKRTSDGSIVVNGESVSYKNYLGTCREFTNSTGWTPHTVEVVIKKNAAGDNLRASSFTLDNDLVDVLFAWLHSSEAPSGSGLILRLAWIGQDGSAIIEDELGLSRNIGRLEIDHFHCGWDLTGAGTETALKLGPFLYESNGGVERRYSKGVRASYTRKVSLEDFNQVKKMKCSIVSRTSEATGSQ